MKHKTIMENFRRYLAEAGEMPPRGHMPAHAGYLWSDETKTFYKDVENLYNLYKKEKDIDVFKAKLFQLWEPLNNKGHGIAVFNDLTDKAEEEKDDDADAFIDAYLDVTMEMYR